MDALKMLRRVEQLNLAVRLPDRPNLFHSFPTS